MSLPVSEAAAVLSENSSLELLRAFVRDHELAVQTNVDGGRTQSDVYHDILAACKRVDDHRVNAPNVALPSPPASPQKAGPGQESRDNEERAARPLLSSSKVPTAESPLKEIRAFVKEAGLHVKVYVGGRRRRTKADIVSEIHAELNPQQQATDRPASVPSEPVTDPETGFEVEKFEHEYDDVEALVVAYVDKTADRLNEVWIDTKTIIRVLGYASSYDPFANQRKRHPELIKGRYIHGHLCLSRKEFLSSLNNLRKVDAAKALLETLTLFFGDTISFVNYNEEDQWISKIKKATHRFSSQLQYNVNGRRIDLYFPRERLAVECDEHNHAAYGPDADRLREIEIIEELGCRFYRFNPHCDNPNHTPEFHIGEILHMLYHPDADAGQC